MRHLIRIFLLLAMLGICLAQQCPATDFIDILDPGGSDSGQGGGTGYQSGINAGAPSGETIPEIGEAVSVRVISESSIPADIVIRYTIGDLEVHRADLTVPAMQTLELIGPDLAVNVLINGTYSNGDPTPDVKYTLEDRDFEEGDTIIYILPDPIDHCPDDPDKTEPGVCGCGIADVDTDGDGTLDCNDACPGDPNKIDPGICGCNKPDDADGDGDGTPDCIDGCINDPNKTDPGACGCSRPDDDLDNNGIVDCLETPPGPPDTDGDGFPDNADNCPTLSNPNQANCDRDTVGDACTIAECVDDPDCADCNNNQIPDACDIANETSRDSNQNRIPDECEQIPKWSQGPQYNTGSTEQIGGLIGTTTNPSCYWGWDEPSIYGWSQIVADDWLCESPAPVSGIQWWGSYSNWTDSQPPANAPDQFHIGIWTHTESTDSIPFNHPDQLIHEWLVNRSNINETPAGCSYRSVSMQETDTCFQYTLKIPTGEWFYQSDPTTIFWISISAKYPSTVPTSNVWGWTTRVRYYGADAVRIYDPTAPTTGSTLTNGSPIPASPYDSWDMSFIIMTPVGAVGGYDNIDGLIGY